MNGVLGHAPAGQPVTRGGQGPQGFLLRGELSIGGGRVVNEPGRVCRDAFGRSLRRGHATVEIGRMLFRLCGARATSAKYDADMYWRNACTLPCTTIWTAS